jgi:hypothetical protein
MPHHVVWPHNSFAVLSLLQCRMCRPLVVEEFGLSKRFFTLEETKVVVAVVADALIAAKRAGKPLMGAWLWQAAPPGGWVGAAAA